MTLQQNTVALTSLQTGDVFQLNELGGVPYIFLRNTAEGSEALEIRTNQIVTLAPDGVEYLSVVKVPAVITIG